MLERGKIGTESRNEYEEGAPKFIISEMLKTSSIEGKLNQEELAIKAETIKKLDL